MIKGTPITQADIEEVGQLLRYDAEAGALIWDKKVARKVVVGTRAGVSRPDGYRSVQVNKKRFMEHRLVFALHNGWCPDEIDHINGNPSDNRIENLRPASRTEQNRNKRVSRKNTTGYKGVYLHKHSGLFAARIKVAGKYICLKYHKTAEKAAEAYQAAAKLYFGEFTRAY